MPVGIDANALSFPKVNWCRSRDTYIALCPTVSRITRAFLHFVVSYKCQEGKLWIIDKDLKI